MSRQILEVRPLEAEQKRASAVFSIGDEVLNTITIDSNVELRLSATGWLAAALPVAMARGCDVHIHGAIDRLALANFDNIQVIFEKWFKFPKVKITASSVQFDLTQGAQTAETRFGTFFSGGVDSFYTALENPESNSLILVQGFDISDAEHQLWEKTLKSSTRVAEALQRELIVVRTNVRELGDRNSLDWGRHYHGAAIAFVAHMISGLHTVAIAASYQKSIREHPWGTHPDLDPQWSSSGLRILHDGSDTSRPQKVARISESDIAMNTLRICYQNPNEAYNCGDCDKCVRTVVNLASVGVLGKCKTLPDKLDYERIERASSGRGGRVFARENLAAMLKTGNVDRRLAQALGKSLIHSYTGAVLRRIPLL
jgi:hypothetical protein